MNKIIIVKITTLNLSYTAIDINRPLIKMFEPMLHHTSEMNLWHGIATTQAIAIETVHVRIVNKTLTDIYMLHIDFSQPHNGQTEQH